MAYQRSDKWRMKTKKKWQIERNRNKNQQRHDKAPEKHIWPFS